MSQVASGLTSFLIRNSAKSLAMNVFWDVMPCNLVEIYELFGKQVAAIFRV
jgi:hypothetical protein